MPIHRQGNIFYKVVTRNENPITEVLCNLFQYKNIRDTLLRFFEIPLDKLDKINYEHIDTQKVKEDSGIPDIVIQNPKVTIYIENKVNQHAPLQGTQVNQYLSKLEKDEKVGKYIRMIYLVPKGYVHSEEIDNAICEKQRYAKVYIWEDFIKYVELSDLDKTSLFVSEFISHYRKLFIQEPITISLNNEEMELLLKPKDLIVANSLISKFTKIMEEVIKPITSVFGERVSFEWSDEGDDYWYNQVEKGVYIKFDGKYLLFYGLSFNLYNDYPEYYDYLFNFQIGSDVENGIDPDPVYIERFKKSTPDYIQYEKNGWYIGKFPNFCLAGDDAPKNVADVLIEKIKMITYE